MIDHVFLTVSDLKRSIAFYEAALAPLGITQRFDYDGNNGPPGHPDLYGFGANGRLYLWLRQGAKPLAPSHLSGSPSNRGPQEAAFASWGEWTGPGRWGDQAPVSPSTHIGFVASSRDQVDAAYSAAMAAGATDNGAPAIRDYYDPRYYAANVLDPDGYSLEFVYKSWQH